MKSKYAENGEHDNETISDAVKSEAGNYEPS